MLISFSIFGKLSTINFVNRIFMALVLSYDFSLISVIFRLVFSASFSTHGINFLFSFVFQVYLNVSLSLKVLSSSGSEIQLLHLSILVDLANSAQHPPL